MTLFAATLVAALGGAAGASLAAPAAGTPSPKHSAVTGSAIVDSSALARLESRPAIFLSWDAPQGMPRAHDAAVAACDDTLGVDTLYITFDPGESLGNLLGVDAVLTFRPGPGDSLGPFWDLSRAGANPWNLRIEFDEPPPGCETPWRVPGIGAPRYRLSPGAGRLDLTYYVPASKAGPVAPGTRYFLARVMVRQRKPQLGGCRQPVCVELNHVLISYNGGSRWINGGERFVSWNSPGGAACAEHRLRPPDEEPPRQQGRFDLPAEGAPPAGAARDSSRR